MLKTSTVLLALALSASASLACSPVRPGSSVVECRTPAQIAEGQKVDAIRAADPDWRPARIYATGGGFTKTTSKKGH